MRKFNFQMFDDSVLEIPGIDSDVLAALAEEESLTGDAGARTEPVATEEQVAAPAVESSEAEVEETESSTEDDPGVGDSAAEADSENKQVGDTPKGTIPYTRFKQELDKRKAAEEEIAALKAKLEQPPALSTQVPPITQQPVAQNQYAQQIPDAEIMKAVTSEAINRAKARMGLSDDDLDSMDFTDNLESRMQFNAIVQQETNGILEVARRNAQERVAFEQGVQDATGQFSVFVNEFQALPDSAERWNYIAEQRFLQLPLAQQNTIKAAFDRLQNRRGTPADFFLAKYYFDQASADYDAQHPASPAQPAKMVENPVTPKVNVAAKVEAAQAIPKAGSVGGASTTTSLSPDDVARALNSPGTAEWDKFPEDVKYKVLHGIPLEG